VNLFHRFQRDDFYASRGWRKARYMTLKTHGRRCACCLRTPEQHGVALHVDHIVPRSRARRKELVLSNLQVLCEDCNLGKGNSDRIKWQGGPAHGGQLLLFGY